jgi:FlaA1/EpsC-like NDP-sugar epimerase
MTIPEAVQLVIQAGAIGKAGEALVLDMGAPVRIADVATHLISMEGRPIPIMYTGLRPGEKLHEELFGAGERDTRPIHPMISHVAVPGFDPQTLRHLRNSGRAALALAQDNVVREFHEPGTRRTPTVSR